MGVMAEKPGISIVQDRHIFAIFPIIPITTQIISLNPENGDSIVRAYAAGKNATYRLNMIDDYLAYRPANYHENALK